VYFESHQLSIVCYVVLGAIGLGGLVAVLTMGILAERGSYDFSVALLYTLEWLCMAACIALTALALHKIVNPEHTEKVRGLYIILIVESILLIGLTLGLILSFFVLYQPPLYAGGGWVQFFAMVAVPDLILFGAFLTLIGYNCWKIHEKAAASKRITLSTKSTSVMGTFDGGEVEMDVPEKYRV
jgi:MFS family permease